MGSRNVLPLERSFAMNRFVLLFAILAVGLRSAAAEEHWAFQPVQKSAIPFAPDFMPVSTPVDAFVGKRLEEAELKPSPPASRSVLMRRLHYTLTGLPPSPQMVADFVNDPDPAAYKKQVDRLLDSPQYGEHWARLWLDVARYSDTKGYVYGLSLIHI